MILKQQAREQFSAPSGCDVGGGGGGGDDDDDDDKTARGDDPS